MKERFIYISILLIIIGTSTASTSTANFTLGIYGNANMDRIIDVEDINYLQDIVAGREKPTSLADANYDGSIDEKDIEQIKQIIDGTEKKLVIQDDAGDAVAIDMPVASAITGDRSHAEAMRAIKATDNIIAVTKGIEDQPVFFPELSKLPSVASEYGKDPDYEKILQLKPSLYLTSPPASVSEDKKNLPGVAVLSLRLYEPAGFEERVLKLGYIFDKVKEAEQYIQWHDGIIDDIRDKIKKTPQQSLPKVLLISVYDSGVINVHTNRSGAGQILVKISVNTLGDTLMGTHPELDPEWVLAQDPQVILLFGFPQSVTCGYNTDDYSKMRTYRETFINDSRFMNTEAVKNERVFLLDSKSMSYSGSYIIGIAYMAKMFYPELFLDMNPQVIHQEYLGFQNLDYDLAKHGAFAYPGL